jgi:ribosomal protein L29
VGDLKHELANVRFSADNARQAMGTLHESVKEALDIHATKKIAAANSHSAAINEAVDVLKNELTNARFASAVARDAVGSIRSSR